MASAIRLREISSLELITTQLDQIKRVNPKINAAVEILSVTALEQAREADEALARGDNVGPLHGVPVSIKDSIDVRGVRTTAGTWGRRHAPVADCNATLVQRLRHAGAIPIAKTNLPDLLFAYESDNLIFGRTNNPYAPDRTAGGSSGGESALIAACGSPLGLGSDAAGSVRIPAAFCGISSLKPTSGRLPRTGHVPPTGGWVEALWQIGPMARFTEDVVLAMQILAGEDGTDWTSPPVPLVTVDAFWQTTNSDRLPHSLRVAFFTDNGIAACSGDVVDAVRKCARFLAQAGHEVIETRPPGVEQAYELEMALLGADGAEGIDGYLESAGSTRTHPLLEAGFVSRMRPHRATAAQLATRWAQWDEYRTRIADFFRNYDVLLCPTYTQSALKHGESAKTENFAGFSYTMAWNLSGNPAATVRCAESDGLPVNIQVVTARWRDLLAVEVCSWIEKEFGGWRPPVI
jgi:amidase